MIGSFLLMKQLVPKKVQVHRGGKVFERTQMVRPEELERPKETARPEEKDKEFEPEKALTDRTRGLHTYTLSQLQDMSHKALEKVNEWKAKNNKEIASLYHNLGVEISLEISDRAFKEFVRVGGTKKGKFEKQVSPEKAKKILEDGEVNGQPLTDKQKRFFGFIAGGGTPTKVDKQLVPKKVQVHRGGKTFERTQMVRPEELEKPPEDVAQTRKLKELPREDLEKIIDKYDGSKNIRQQRMADAAIEILDHRAMQRQMG